MVDNNNAPPEAFLDGLWNSWETVAGRSGTGAIFANALNHRKSRRAVSLAGTIHFNREWTPMDANGKHAGGLTTMDGKHVAGRFPLALKFA
jgi:hypothetical protein